MALCVLVMAGMMPMCGRTEVRTWCGEGADDNFSTAENWVGGVAPVSGDTLVFMGDKRTSPYNDFEPYSLRLNGIVFSNNYVTSSSTFTLKGNGIYLGQTPANTIEGCSSVQVCPIAIPNKTPGVPAEGLTDTIEMDIKIDTNGALFGNGSESSPQHHLLFKGIVENVYKKSGNPYGSLRNLKKYCGQLTFEGPVTNFTFAGKENGYATIWLKSPQNVFYGSSDHSIPEGALKVDSPEAFGLTKGIILGVRNATSHRGVLTVNPQEDSVFPCKIKLQGNMSSKKLTTAIVNGSADVTATFTGEISTSSVDDTGVKFEICGVGNGVIAGSIVSNNVFITKSGTGTWTLAAESTNVSTGNVSVTAGKLIVNGDYSTMKKFTVSKNAMFGGTGTVSNVTLNNSTFFVGGTAAGPEALKVTDTLTLSGDVSVEFDESVGMRSGTERAIITWGTLSNDDNHVFTLVNASPLIDGTKLVLKENGLYASRGSKGTVVIMK